MSLAMNSDDLKKTDLDTASQRSELVTSLVKQVLQVEETTWGSPQQQFLVRYRGHLLLESEAAYERLSQLLKPYEITPLFRIEKNSPTIILVEGVIEPKPSNPWVNLVLFVITIFSVLLAGTLYGYQGPVSEDSLVMLRYILGSIWTGWPFALSLLAILLAHEFGHYLAARYHRSAVTLPYFIPFPLSYFGTMGAFIQLKEPPKNKKILLDIGAAGPYAGLVVAIPVLFLGLVTSNLNVLPANLQTGQGFEGNSIFYLLAKYAVFGEMLPRPESYLGISPVLYWLRYFFTGSPLPHGGLDVTLNQVAWAGWAGLLVTALNLIPAGQLDGGHLLYVLIGSKAKKVLPLILIALVVLGFFWPSWWLWVFILLLLGRFHAEPLDQITPLDPRRKFAAAFGLVVFVLLFMPVPLLTIM
jgi:membrane-associated protease RseP (regulator of RpoE activity)